MGIRSFWRERRLWRPFYWQWAKQASLSFRLADGFAAVLAIFIPAGIKAFQKWGGVTFSESTESVLNDLLWQIPLGILGGLTVVRLFLAPYWIYRETQRDISGSLLSTSPSYEGRRGVLDFKDDFPKALREFNRLTSRLISHIEAAGKDFGDVNTRVGKINPESPDKDARALREAKRMAGRLHRHSGRIKKMYPKLDEVAKRLGEDIVGVSQSSADMATDTGALSESKTTLEDVHAAYSEAIVGLDQFTNTLQGFIDKPLSKDLDEACFEMVGRLKGVRTIYKGIEEGCATGIAAIGERLTEIRK